MANIVTAYIITAHIIMAYLVVAKIIMAYLVMAYLVMAYIVMAYLVMAYIVMAYLVMAQALMRVHGSLVGAMGVERGAGADIFDQAEMRQAQGAIPSGEAGTEGKAVLLRQLMQKLSSAATIKTTESGGTIVMIPEDALNEALSSFMVAFKAWGEGMVQEVILTAP